MHASASTSIFNPQPRISLNLSITNFALRNIGLYQSSLLYPRTIWSTIDDASDTTDMFPVIMELEWSVYRPRSRSMRDVHENKLDEVMDVEETQYLTISIDSTRFFLLFLPLFFVWWRLTTSLTWIYDIFDCFFIMTVQDFRIYFERRIIGICNTRKNCMNILSTRITYKKKRKKLLKFHLRVDETNIS